MLVLVSCSYTIADSLLNNHSHPTVALLLSVVVVSVFVLYCTIWQDGRARERECNEHSIEHTMNTYSFYIASTRILYGF